MARARARARASVRRGIMADSCPGRPGCEVFYLSQFRIHSLSPIGVRSHLWSSTSNAALCAGVARARRPSCQHESAQERVGPGTAPVRVGRAAACPCKRNPGRPISRSSKARRAMPKGCGAGSLPGLQRGGPSCRIGRRPATGACAWPTAAGPRPRSARARAPGVVCLTREPCARSSSARRRPCRTPSGSPTCPTRSSAS